MEYEKKNKRKVIIISAAIHTSLLLLVIFLIAWRVPDPPNPEYGIEINFGTQNFGNGKVQPKATVDQQATEETQNEDTQNDEVEAQEPVETTSENVESTEETPVENTPIEDSQPVETAESQNQEVAATDSPDVVETATETTQAPETPTEEKPIEEVKSEKVEPKKEVEEAKPINSNAQSEKPAANNSVENAEEDNDSSGNGDKSTEGDQGEPDGKVEAQALYGNPGSSNGSSLELSGWKWDDEPEPDDTSIESGKIVFKITVDDEGIIVEIKTLEKTVTPAVEQVYRRAVEELTFSKKSDYKPASFSTGRITFIIKAN